jgi:hypothetical protein
MKHWSKQKPTIEVYEAEIAEIEAGILRVQDFLKKKHPEEVRQALAELDRAANEANAALISLKSLLGPTGRA